MKDLLDTLKKNIEPFQSFNVLFFNSSGFAGGYLGSSPSDLFCQEILKGLNLFKIK